jgi:hypothetical protein
MNLLARRGLFATKTGFRTPEKRGSGDGLREKRVGPHPGSPVRVVCALGWRPHAVSGACATFFVIVDGVLHTVFFANRPHRFDERVNNPGL